MAKTGKKPCRVCKKLFEPCSVCQSDNTMFRWRNFACSKECATKYINDTIAYRESLKIKDNKISGETETIDKDDSVEKNITTRKTTLNIVDTKNESENNETE